mgnify:CR=1 FL=1
MKCEDKNGNVTLEDVIIAFAEAMPTCTSCPLDDFCNRTEEGRRYGTCAGAANAWLKTHREILCKTSGRDEIKKYYKEKSDETSKVL